jgi:hypothetical protein
MAVLQHQRCKTKAAEGIPAPAEGKGTPGMTRSRCYRTIAAESRRAGRALPPVLPPAFCTAAADRQSKPSLARLKGPVV